jgi:hypothetical protein
MINPFNNIYDLFSHFGVCYKNAASWRLTEATPGQIEGLDSSHGILLATNGILCLIERAHKNTSADTPQLFQGHLDFFIPYKPKQTEVRSKDSNVVYEVGKAARQAKKEKEIQKMLDILNQP